MKRSLLLLYFCLLGVALSHAQVVINELMQSNIDCIMDDLNEFPDSWVELYNAGDEAVNLKDYQLGTSNKAKKAYQLPSFLLQPKGYKIVYCDKTEDEYEIDYKNSRAEITKKAANHPWHASFRLESGKDGSVFLFKDKEVVDSIVNMKKQPAPNISFGRKTDGAEKTGYQLVPTPGTTNCGKVCSKDDILSDPIFSVPGQVYESSASLDIELSIPEKSPEGTKILYTLDGSEPSLDNKNTKEYTSPIKFSKTGIIRAKLVCDGYLSPRSVAQSYLFLGRTMTLPVVSITTDKKYLTDSKIGIYVDGSYMSGKKNYEFDWRRPINIELFEKAGDPSVINQLCETRIQGGATRGSKLKSLALYANKRFGEKRFDYEFFPEDRPGQTNFKSLILRNAGNDFDYLYMRDAIIQRTMAKHVDIDYQAWRPAIVFINGEYKGIENFRERSNDDNIFTNYNELEDIEMIENWGEIKVNDGSLFKKLEEFYYEKGHTYEEFNEHLDVSEFIDVLIMDLYFNNLDAPGNNFCIWRETADNSRWRSLVKDVDYTMGLYNDPYNYKILDWFYNHDFDWGHRWSANEANGTRLYRRMLDNEIIRNLFLDRCSVYMGDFMNLNGVWEVWKPMYEMIKTEYPKHRALINQWWPNYNDEMNNAKKWLQQRNDFFYKHLSDYYKLGAPMKLEVNKNLTETELADIEVEMNGVKLSKNVFDGKFFQNREVKLSGKHVGSWKITTIDKNGGVTDKVVEGAECSFIMPECSSVKVNVAEFNSIEDVILSEVSSPIDYYDISGTKYNHLQKGHNIIRMKDGSVKKVLW